MIQTRNFLKSRTKPIFLQHLQGHQHLPGILSQGNAIADSLASSSQCYLTQDEAISFHDLIHVNWRGLQHRYPHVPIKELKKIIRTCKSCSPFLQLPPLQGPRVNPHGLAPNHLWQTDVTYFTFYGKLKYIFVTVDTFSHACWATAHTSEKAKHANNHLLQCFVVLGIPKQIITDNGPCFTSASFATFLKHWEIKHVTGIPYNPYRPDNHWKTKQNIKGPTFKIKRGSSTPSWPAKDGIMHLKYFKFFKNWQPHSFPATLDNYS